MILVDTRTSFTPFVGYVKKESVDAGWTLEVYAVQPGENILVKEHHGLFSISSDSFIIALNYYGCAHIEWEATNALGSSLHDEKPKNGATYTIGFSKIWLFFENEANEAKVSVKIRLHDPTKEDNLGDEEIVHLKLVRQ